MYRCMPLSILPIQSDLDLVSESGDTVLIPQRVFETWFGNFTGGLLGVRLIDIDHDVELYATSAPHNEEEDHVYLPDWMMLVLREKTLQLEGELCINLRQMTAELPTVRRIVVRSIDEIGDGVDIRTELEKFLYDCHYIQENTVLRPVPGIEVWIERVFGPQGAIVAGILDGEVDLEILSPLDSAVALNAIPEDMGSVAEAVTVASPEIPMPLVPPPPFPAEQREMTRQEIAQLRMQWWQNRIAPFMNASNTEGSQLRP